MKKCLYVFSFVCIGILAFVISGCDDSMEEIVDNVVTPPTTEPILPPELTGIDQGYTFYMSLDHQTPINDVAFSWDGQWLASLGENSLKLWDPQTGQLKETRSIESGDLWIDRISADGGVRLTGPNSFEFERAGHTSPIRSFVDMGNRYVTGSSDRTIRVWDPQTGELHFALDLPGQVWSVAVGRFGSTLAGGGGFDGIYLWDVFTGQSKGILRADTAQVEGIAFGSDDDVFGLPPNILAVATGLGSGEAIHVWDLRTNILKQTLIADGYTVRKVAISPDGQMIVGGAYYGAGPAVLLWKKE